MVSTINIVETIESKIEQRERSKPIEPTTGEYFILLETSKLVLIRFGTPNAKHRSLL